MAYPFTGRSSVTGGNEPVSSNLFLVSSARTRILEAADRMFTEQGIREVGVDAIGAAADTAKTTLYAHFGSKDALVAAYLERRAAQRQERLERKR